MSLYDAMKRRGYTFRQHLEEEGWGWHKPTVVDLDMVQRDELQRAGIDGLKAQLDSCIYRPAWGLWTFPCYDISQPLPRRSDLVLARDGRATAAVVAPASDRDLRGMADDFIKSVAELHGVDLPLVDADTATLADLAGRDLVLFGGSHRNRVALDLALRHRTFFADATVPGDDGWLITTHCGTDASGRNVLQVAAGDAHRATVLTALREAVTRQDGTVVVRHMHRVQPGAAMSARFPSWAVFTSSLPKRLPQLQGESIGAPTDPTALADVLARGFHSGGKDKGIYNAAPWDIAIDVARYYQLSADDRALRLFREMLFRAVDYYLKTPGGASYPADLDFRLGLLVLHYARLEHEAVFSEEDRLILVNFLLACSRSIHEYAVKFWPSERIGDSRHNHQTFPALSLTYCADYFARHGIDVSRWRAYADTIFSGRLWTRGKQIENSRSYEPYVFEHAAEYSAFLGRGLSLFQGDGYRNMVMRQIIATDNFFRPVDYGDTAISMTPAQSPTARMLAAREDGVIRWFAGESFARQPSDLPGAISDFPGLVLGVGLKPPAAGEWESAPVDPLFLQEVSPGLPHPRAFDKLGFRTGWGEEDQYLLLEGVTGSVSHAHHDTNGIVRYNHLGRHWIVSNGYGRRIGLANASKAFASREVGPADHNLLVLQRDGKLFADLPMAASLQLGRQGRALHSTTALLNCGGLDWFRTLVVLCGAYLVVLDRVRVLDSRLQSAHVEWNALGRASTHEQGARLEQQGVFLDLVSPSGWPVEHGVGDQSACWKRVLEDGSYPYAAFPLVKLRYRMPPTAPGETRALATLLAATRGEASYEIAQPEPQRLLINGPHEGCDGLRVDDGDLSILANAGGCEIRFGPVTDVPDAVLKWSRERKHRE